MSPLLIALLGILLLPLFVGTWRVSLVGLASQGLLMAWIAYRMGPPPASLADAPGVLRLVDLGLVRGVIVPATLYATLVAQKAPARQDVIPPNLLSWTLALGMVLMAFNLAGMLAPESGQQETLLAVAASGVLLGFLVLATQSQPFGQMIGILRVENGIALFELGGGHHHKHLALQVGPVAILLVSVGLYRWYLAMAHAPDGAGAYTSSHDGEEPTL